MITLYVLDVAEFAPVVRAAEADPACRVSRPRHGYWTIQAEHEMRFRRRDMKLKPAIWYGAFTGGLDGVIAEFGPDLVRVLPAAAAGPAPQAGRT